MSYTKGEWHLDPLTGEIRADGNRIAKVYGATAFNHMSNAEECMVNARLVLKAPKMFHALKKAQKALSMNLYSEVLADEIQELIEEVEHD